MSPWQILGIPYGSPRHVVKEAYARLLKQHRPDRDPVGFRRIRDAYEQLRDVPEQEEQEHGDWEEEELPPRAFAAESADDTDANDDKPAEDDTLEVQAAARSAEDEAPPADPDEDPPLDLEEEEFLELSPPRRLWRAPFHMRLQRALYRTSVQSDPQRELRVLRVLVQSWRSAREPMTTVRLLLTALGQKPLVQTLLTPADVTDELDRGSWAITSALLQAQLAGGDIIAANGVVAAIEAWCARSPKGNCAPFLVEAAGYLAFLDRGAAGRLLDAAFRLRSGGDLHTGDVDLRIAVGREIRASTFAERLNFTRALLLPPERRNDADESMAATAMRQRYGCAPLLATLFKARLPKRWDFVIAAPREVRPPQPVQRPRPVRPHEPLRTEPEARRLTDAASLAWLIVALVFLAVFWSASRKHERTPSSTIGLPSTLPAPDQQRIRSLLWPEQQTPPKPQPAPPQPNGGR